MTNGQVLCVQLVYRYYIEHTYEIELHYYGPPFEKYYGVVGAYA